LSTRRAVLVFGSPFPFFLTEVGFFYSEKKYLLAVFQHPQGNRSLLFLQGNEVGMRSVSASILNIALPLFILHGNASDVSFVVFHFARKFRVGL